MSFVLPPAPLDKCALQRPWFPLSWASSSLCQVRRLGGRLQQTVAEGDELQQLGQRLHGTLLLLLPSTNHVRLLCGPRQRQPRLLQQTWVLEEQVGEQLAEGTNQKSVTSHDLSAKQQGCKREPTSFWI